MNAHDLLAKTAQQHAPLRLLVACEPTAGWARRGLDELVPPVSLAGARARRDELRTLLSRERAAAADFLLALADFDRRRGWERLGHASLFAFLTRELGLSSGAAQLRLSAARLLPRHPAVEDALRSGLLCISAVGQLARVLTVENEAGVLPRFLGLSAREAAEVAASILPRLEPARREVVTSWAPARPGRAADASPAMVAAAGETLASTPSLAPEGALHTYEVPPPARVPPRTPTVEPLTADLRRLHLTVSKGFLDKAAAARTGLSHALPGATMEQVLEAALDLLLERQAQRKGLGRRARRATPDARPLGPHSTPVGDEAPEGAVPISSVPLSSQGGVLMGPSQEVSTSPRPAHRPHVPAAIEREVRLRDGDRCQFPLDAGGVCGSTWQVELDHVIPFTLGGPTSPANLRCACRPHNQAAAEDVLGPAVLWPARLRRARQGRP